MKSFLKLTDVNSPDLYSILNENVRRIKVPDLHIPNDWSNDAKNPSDSDESDEENVYVCVCMSNALLQS